MQVQQPSSSSRSMYITIFSTFLAFMGMGVVDPILPVIGEEIGALPWQVEMLFTAYIFTMAFTMIPAGISAGHFGEKRIMVIGMTIVSLFSLLCALSHTIPELSWFRAGWGFGNAMFFATAMPLLIKLSPNAGRAVGFFEAAVGLGMAAGPLVGGLLGQMNWRYPFAITSLLVFFAFLLTTFFVKQIPRPANQKVHGFAELAHLLKYRPFLIVALSGMLYYFGFFTVLAYSPLMLHLSVVQLGLVFFGWGLLLAYGSAKLAHKVEEHVSPRTALAYSLGAFALILLGIFVIPNHVVQTALIVISGLSCGMCNALFTAYSMEISPYERSITSSAFNFMRWLGAAVAPVASGLIAHQIGLVYPYAIAFVLVIAALVPFIIPKKSTVQA